MPPADYEQRRREMVASFESLHLQPPIPPTPKPNNPIPILISADLLTEILLRLPVKSVNRSKSVCKEWLSLISSDYFCHQYTLRRPKLLLQHSALFSDPDYFLWNPTSINGGENMTIPYTLSLPPHHRYKIRQACNGLLLLKGFEIEGFEIDEGIGVKTTLLLYHCVYNPTTRLSTVINIPTCKDVAAMALAFDPSKSPYYKIVCCISKRDGTYQVDVYDSESRSWKLCLEAFTPSSKFDCYEAQYWNNAIYWWRSYNNGTFYYCFDIAKNEMKELSFPLSRSHSYLQELDGRLYYLTLSFSYSTIVDGRLYHGCKSHKLRAAVWELGGDDEWLLKHNRVFDCDGIGKFVRLMGDSEDLLVVIYHQSGEVKMSMDIKKKEMKMKMKSYSFLNKRCEDLV